MTFLRDIPGVKDGHEYIEIFTDDDYITACRVCGQRWKRKHNRGRCTGCRIYDTWKEVPAGLVSKTKMSRECNRIVPDGALPFAVVRTKSDKNIFTLLYPIVAGKPKPRSI